MLPGVEDHLPLQFGRQLRLDAGPHAGDVLIGHQDDFGQPVGRAFPGFREPLRLVAEDVEQQADRDFAVADDYIVVADAGVIHQSPFDAVHTAFDDVRQRGDEQPSEQNHARQRDQQHESLHGGGFVVVQVARVEEVVDHAPCLAPPVLVGEDRAVGPDRQQDADSDHDHDDRDEADQLIADAARNDVVEILHPVAAVGGAPLPEPYGGEGHGPQWAASASHHGACRKTAVRMRTARPQTAANRMRVVRCECCIGVVV